MEVFSLYVSNGEGVPMSRHAPRYCYNCSNEGHFGDDCPTLPGHLQASPTSFRAALMSNTGKPIKRSRSPTPPRPHKHGRRSYPSDSEDSFGRDRLHRRHRSESEDSVPHRRHSLRLDEKARTHDDADSNAKPKGKKNKKGKNASERLPSTTDKGKDPAARQATIPDVPVPPAHSLASTSSQPGSHPAASAPGRHGMGTKQTKKRSASRKRQKAKKKMAGLVNEGATRQMGLHPPLPLDQAHHPTHPPPVISVRPNNPSSSVPPPSLLQHALSGQNNWKALQQPSASAPAPAYPPPLYYRPHSAATHPPPPITMPRLLSIIGPTCRPTNSSHPRPSLVRPHPLNLPLRPLPRHSWAKLGTVTTHTANRNIFSPSTSME
ncbi:hypothetical protein DM01DRAFT_1096750 [Hesseltinella vesiculosa]|uniref:CCHC-type domain-containing protein n=1 Tax=Hesseltinella vesiculosa TaxID=101127 RepID=A0A1X2GCG1_9FUNG|nr:hypothetical protein DM01DRAFT_1096750 [Hesseltinella vesiculosa]